MNDSTTIEDGGIHHQVTIERHGLGQRKETCATLDALERVIDYAVKWKVNTWDDYTDSMVWRIEFSGEALKKIMKAGLESLARKKVRQDPESRRITL
jgi:hypothetical protein